MPDIFLSYNRADQATARRFADGLKAEGFDVWWDATLKAGEAYDEVTETALRTAKAVVVLWSPRSAASRWVRAEATLADRNKTLVPVTIEPCERPIMFELTQTADLCHWRGAVYDPVWRALVDDIRRHGGPRDQVPTPGIARDPARQTISPRGRTGGAPSLAVLPFGNRSGLAEDDAFAFGMVEDIIDALSQGVALRVIASSATARFRHGALPDLAAMAQQLDVQFVLEGNLRRAGEDLRVTTQLCDALSGDIIWTHKFQRPLAQLSALQEDLVLEVAAHLRAQTNRAEIERALRKPDDLTAWEMVWRSISAFRTMTGPALMSAIADANLAVEIAPDYPLALVQLGQAQATLYFNVFPDDEAEVRRIRALMDKGVSLDPDNSLILSTAGGVLAVLGFPDEGLTLARRAIQINPNNQFGYYSCGMALALLNRPDEAIAHLNRELELAPGNPLAWLSYLWQATACTRAARWEAAALAYEEGLKLAPDIAPFHLGRALCLRAMGRHDEARAAMGRGRSIEADTPLDLWALRYHRSHAGAASHDEVLDHLRTLWAETEPA